MLSWLYNGCLKTGIIDKKDQLAYDAPTKPINDSSAKAKRLRFSFKLLFEDTTKGKLKGGESLNREPVIDIEESKMNITKFSEANPFQNIHGVEAKKILTTKSNEEIHMSLARGQELRNTQPQSTTSYILEGVSYVERATKGSMCKKTL